MRALAFGVSLVVLGVCILTCVHYSLTKPRETMGLGFNLYFTATGYFSGAIVIVAICVPIWRLMGIARLNGWVAAICLGFAISFAVMVIPHLGSASDLSKHVGVGGIYGMVGAFGGIATWWARPGVVRRPSADVFLNVVVAVLVIWLVAELILYPYILEDISWMIDGLLFPSDD